MRPWPPCCLVQFPDVVSTHLDICLTYNHPPFSRRFIGFHPFLSWAATHGTSLTASRSSYSERYSLSASSHVRTRRWPFSRFRERFIAQQRQHRNSGRRSAWSCRRPATQHVSKRQNCGFRGQVDCLLASRSSYSRHLTLEQRETRPTTSGWIFSTPLFFLAPWQAVSSNFLSNPQVRSTSTPCSRFSTPRMMLLHPHYGHSACARPQTRHFRLSEASLLLPSCFPHSQT